MFKYFLVAFVMLISLSLSASDYVAVVDGITIDVKSFDLIYQDSLRDYKRYQLLSNQGSLGYEEINRLKDSVLDALIENALIEKFAKNEKIEITDKEIKEAINKLQQGFQSKEDFWRALKAQDISFDKLVDNIKEQMVRDKIVATVYPDYGKISTKDIIGYLKKNKLFMFPVQYNITLLVTNNYEYINNLIKSELLLGDWSSLAIDMDRSYESLVISEDDLPIPVAACITSIDMNTFSEVRSYNSDQYFSVKINQIVNMPLFDVNNISKAVKDSLVEEKRIKYYNDWVGTQREQSQVTLNPEIFPKHDPVEADDGLFLEHKIDVPIEENDFTAS